MYLSRSYRLGTATITSRVALPSGGEEPATGVLGDPDIRIDVLSDAVKPHHDFSLEVFPIKDIEVDERTEP